MPMSPAPMFVLPVQFLDRVIWAFVMSRVVAWTRKIPGLRQLGRLWVNSYPEGSITPIRFGPARGLFWKRSHKYVNDYWLGTFEPAFQEALASHIKAGMTVFDIGANAGFYSLLARKQAGREGTCISVDPDPGNCENIKTLREINHFDCWEVVQAAISNRIGQAVFEARGHGDSGGHLVELKRFHGDNPVAFQSYEVPLLTLDELAKRYGSPHLIKMDIECAEYEVLCSDTCRETLKLARPTLILELHGNERAIAIQQALKSFHYRLLTFTGTEPDFSKNDIFQVIAKPG
jgi:FkbM family methyltransferase